ncbi:universal stress protein [Aestuariivivens sediminicola]|uniref:universal stress protein n=1 Tax=Aestuariivivens sediminicola TaxID=2913560 RepID=UPI001F56B1E4|nr:universal stress protein [Aestuariivivens sediminicola]
MKNVKRKILVLADFNKSVESILKNTAGLAKIVDADIDVLYVKKPTELVEKESQLSAMRTINKEHFKIKKEMLITTEPISEASGININCSLHYGNVKNEITQYIQEIEPDIIVLGKRKSKKINLSGDNIADFVIKEFSGPIMISADENAFELDKDLTLGLFNNSEDTSNLMFVKELINTSVKPLKSFRIVKNAQELEEIKETVSELVDEYVFEYTDNTVKSISNYMLKNNVNLLLLERSKTNMKSKSKNFMSDLKTMMDTLNVSMLLTGVEHPDYSN